MNPRSKALAFVVLTGLVGACGAGASPSATSAAGATGLSAVSGAVTSAAIVAASPSQAGPVASTATVGASGATGGAIPTNPCLLLTQAEVSQIVGQTVGPGDNSTDSHECDFQYPANDLPKIQASITIETAKTIDYLCRSGEGFTVTKLTGIGDNACFDDIAGMTSGDNLTFAHRGHVFTVAASFGASGTTPQILAADKALALAALGHM